MAQTIKIFLQNYMCVMLVNVITGHVVVSTTQSSDEDCMKICKFLDWCPNCTNNAKTCL